MVMEKKLHSESGLDRISELPESIRVHILSFLTTKEAVRTSILSNSWRILPTLLPNLDLNVNCLMKYNFSTYDVEDVTSDVKRESFIRMREGFFVFLDRVFASSMKLDKIKLYVPGFKSDMSPRLDHWVDGAIRRCVNDFELGFGETLDIWYCVPRNILTANTIVKLKFWGCELYLPSKMDTLLPSLRTLCLHDVILNEIVMESLLDSCFNLEDFTLKNCGGFRKLEIVGLMKLEKVLVEKYRNDVKAIKIDAPNLLGFGYLCYGYSWGDTCHIELKGCEKMKELEIIGSHMKDSDLAVILKNLPLLENLFLNTCDRLSYVGVCCQHLVRLAFRNCWELVKVRTATPKLKFFTYEGEDPISFVRKGPALKLSRACVSLKTGSEGSEWFVRLVMLLSKLRHSEKVILEVATEKDVIIPEIVRTIYSPPLYAVKHLMVEFRVPVLKSLVVVVASLLWLAPCLESLLIEDSKSLVSKSMKFQYEKPLKGKKKCGCWKSLPVNCWQHSLKTVWIENRGRAEGDTKLVNFLKMNRIDGKIECFIKNPEPEF